MPYLWSKPLSTSAALSEASLANMDAAFAKEVQAVEAVVKRVSRSPRAGSSFHWGDIPELAAATRVALPHYGNRELNGTVFEESGHRIGALARSVSKAQLLPQSNGSLKAYFIHQDDKEMTLMAPALPIIKSTWSC